MGITVNTMEQLLRARRIGVDFAVTATLGHQAYFHCTHDAYRKLVRDHGLEGSRFDRDDPGFLVDGCYADALFHDLGARELEVYDASAYEGATQLHDFNTRIGSAHRERYTAVFDGGSLEHVFNVPVALENLMSMVAVGGHYISAVPCNNWAGHGFYQFSPELFFRALSPENGFDHTSVIAYAETGPSSSLELVDPLRAGRRLEFSSSGKLSLFVVAKRVAAVPMFGSYPHQSDYQFSSWKQEP